MSDVCPWSTCCEAPKKRFFVHNQRLLASSPSSCSSLRGHVTICSRVSDGSRLCNGSWIPSQGHCAVAPNQALGFVVADVEIANAMFRLCGLRFRPSPCAFCIGLLSETQVRQD